MREWSVEMEIPHQVKSADRLADLVDDLLETLAPYAAVASHDAYMLSVRFNISASEAISAAEKAKRVFATALRKLDFPHIPRLIRVEIETVEDLTRRLQESNAPDIVGVSEVAEMLNTTKQRASALARSRSFPRPIAVLASGPVWRRNVILRYVGQWPRKPGRPPKLVAAAKMAAHPRS